MDSSTHSTDTPSIATPAVAPAPVFAMVVGEVSGDVLGAGLMQAILDVVPKARFVGVGGPKMNALGFESWFAMDRLAVMGIVDVLKRLPELLNIRSELVRRFIREQPNAFIGIDAPDFNLGLALGLKKASIPTVHYVSPSIWAWRSGRIKTIQKAVDLMLTLFPFEADLYTKENVSATFVGHPLADSISLEDQSQWGREQLGLEENKVYLGVLPGSRSGEIKHIAPAFLKTLIYLHEQCPDLTFLVPMTQETKANLFKGKIKGIPGASSLPIKIYVGRSHEVMAASDSLLIASGTATLEALLFKKPMVVAYRWHPITHALISPFVKTKYISLPNILAKRALVPEFVQHQAKPSVMADAVLAQLSPNNNMDMIRTFSQIHASLREHADQKVARAILDLCQLSAKKNSVERGLIGDTEKRLNND